MASPLPALYTETKENKKPTITIPDYRVNEGPLTKVQKIARFVRNKRHTVNSGNLGGFPINKVKRKTRRKQKGGFYPSVYGGVCGAKILAPLVARQMMRMYDTHSKRKTKRRSKKLSHKKRG
jgi:hypothetical protein